MKKFISVILALCLPFVLITNASAISESTKMHEIVYENREVEMYNGEEYELILLEYRTGDALAELTVNGEIVGSTYISQKDSTLYHTDSAGMVSSIEIQTAQMPTKVSQTNNTYTYHGRIQYQYSAPYAIGSCLAQVWSSETISYYGHYDINQTFQDRTALIGIIASILAIPIGFANIIAGTIMSVAGIDFGAVSFKIEDCVIDAYRSEVTWRVADTTYPGTYQYWTGTGYIADIGSVDELRYAGSSDYFAPYEFSNRNPNLALEVFAYLFADKTFTQILNWYDF